MDYIRIYRQEMGLTATVQTDFVAVTGSRRLLQRAEELSV